jgi:hypothetical protein
MARGWESKAVESQIEDAESRPAPGPQRPPDPVELQRQRTRESLELARKRVVHDLETSHSFRLEKMLRASLQHLDEKIAALK